MATINPTRSDVSEKRNGSAIVVTWTNVTEADTCTAINMPEFADKSIQVAGTFGGTSVAIQGSNDGSNFSALRDPTSTVIAITTAAGGAGLKAVLENTWQIKPVLTGGASVSLTISVLCRLAQPLRT